MLAAEQVFTLPIRRSQPPVIRQKDLPPTFHYIDRILALSSELLAAVEGRMRNWGPNQRLGAIFRDLAPKLEQEVCPVGRCEIFGCGGIDASSLFFFFGGGNDDI